MSDADLESLAAMPSSNGQYDFGLWTPEHFAKAEAIILKAQGGNYAEA